MPLDLAFKNVGTSVADLAKGLYGAAQGASGTLQRVAGRVAPLLPSQPTAKRTVVTVSPDDVLQPSW